MDIVKQLHEYIPYNEQEQQDKQVMLSLLVTQESLFFRENLWAHMTASAWVVNEERTKILLAYHNLYRAWSWLGGHADGERNLLLTAEREVLEESGLKKIRPVTNDIFSIEILTVDGHEKRGIYVPSHLHLNVTYLFEADDKEPLSIKPDENSAVAWFGLSEAVSASSELWMRERIYQKLNDKLEAKLRV